MSEEPKAGSDAEARVGLCHSCQHVRISRNPRSVFYRCARAETDRRYPKYPPLPVRKCAGFEEKGDRSIS